MATKPNNAKVVETCTRRLRSLGSYVARDAKIAINGRKHAHGDVVAIYQQCLDARATVARLRAQLVEAIGTVGETEAARREADAALKAWARAQFGVGSTQAAGVELKGKTRAEIEGMGWWVERRKGRPKHWGG